MFPKIVPILPVLLPHLDWWTHRENVLTGVALLHPVPSLTLYTETENFPLGEKSDLNLSCNIPPKTGSLGKEVSETFSKK
jgi:hypothetical protein